jgi:hypothetical protein
MASIFTIVTVLGLVGEMASMKTLASVLQAASSINAGAPARVTAAFSRRRWSEGIHLTNQKRCYRLSSPHSASTAS